MDAYIQNIMKNAGNKPDEDAQRMQQDKQNMTNDDTPLPPIPPPNFDSRGSVNKPTVIESEWAFYAISGVMLWNVYRKYFSKNYSVNNIKSGCPVSNTKLKF